jgi:hypothetical protein
MGEQQQREAEPREAEQRNAGWLARWRERRRNNSARAADISRRSVEAERRNIDNSFKHGGNHR